MAIVALGSTGVGVTVVVVGSAGVGAAVVVVGGNGVGVAVVVVGCTGVGSVDGVDTTVDVATAVSCVDVETGFDTLVGGAVAAAATVVDVTTAGAGDAGAGGAGDAVVVDDSASTLRPDAFLVPGTAFTGTSEASGVVVVEDWVA